MMFALRRASNPLRNKLHCLRAAAAGATQTYHTKSKFLHQISPTQSNNLYQTQPHHRNLFTFLGFSSKSGLAQSNGEEEQEQEQERDVKDGSSDLHEVISAIAKADEEDSEVKTVPFNLFTVIASATSRDIYAVLDNCIEEVRALQNVEISKVLHCLWKCKMYEKAYQLSNWLETKGIFKFEDEKDYVTRLDLIAKVRGMAMAEKYMNESIPERLKGEKVYGTMLCNFVILGNVKKAEQLFDKMKGLGFAGKCFSCEQMILLYRRSDRKKIASVISFMEENDVKPSPFVYQVLMDVKGQSNDIPGMEGVVEAMKSDGLELDNRIRAVLARHYIHAGFDEKAGEILKDMEGEDSEENRLVYKDLLPLYAALGKSDEVERIWNVCESNDRADDYFAAISAFGKVGKVEKAEEIFEKRIKSGKSLSSKGYAVLLNVYIEHKLLAKGKDLAKRMASANHPIDRFVWDTLVRLYIDAGEVEKADSVLEKAIRSKGVRPSYKAFQLIMDQYSRRGDIHNTERIFHSLRQSGYVGKIWYYQSLLQAYIKAKAPVYGFRERLKADNLIPNKLVAAQLAQVDPFKKTAVAALSDLLD